MTTIRGKEPLSLRGVRQVDADHYSMKILVRVYGYDSSDSLFDAVGTLSPECATDLIRKLRRALRQVRDDSHRRLEQAVNNAEGQL